jgi:hypothetical protein
MANLCLGVKMKTAGASLDPAGVFDPSRCVEAAGEQLELEAQPCHNIHLTRKPHRVVTLQHCKHMAQQFMLEPLPRGEHTSIREIHDLPLAMEMRIRSRIAPDTCVSAGGTAVRLAQCQGEVGGNGGNGAQSQHWLHDFDNKDGQLENAGLCLSVVDEEEGGEPPDD